MIASEWAGQVCGGKVVSTLEVRSSAPKPQVLGSKPAYDGFRVAVISPVSNDPLHFGPMGAANNSEFKRNIGL